MQLITNEQRQKMLYNGRMNSTGLISLDPLPVVKLFTPWGAATWLLTELDPRDEDIAFGLCDLGMGCPELGNVSLSDLQSVRGRFGLTVERDLHFTADKPLSAYADAARAADRIVT